MRAISYTDQRIDGGVERTLQMGNDSIAVIFFLPPSPDVTVVWPLTDDVRLLDVLDGFASDFRHQGSSPFAGADIEFWIGDVYTRSEVPDEEGEAPDIVEALYLRASELRNPLELLRLTYDGVCVELTFDDATHDVDRAAVIALDFDVTALNTFFTRFHPDKAMLDDETALEEAFRTALRNPLLAGAYSQGSTSAGA